MRLLMLALVIGCGAEKEDASTGDTGVGHGDPNDGDTDTGAVPPPPGIAALGSETNDVANVQLTEIGSSSDGHDVPRDLAFSPYIDNQLWVVNRADDSVTIYSDVGTGDQSSEHLIDPYALHFMEEVATIAFGAAEHPDSVYPNFGTCHESLNTYNDQAVGNEFMGPTLWSSDPDIFALANDEAIEYLSEVWGVPSYQANLGSHLDMLHETPLCMGMAWESENLYWVFNGKNGSIERVDFQADHGPGFDDHDDGVIGRYVEGYVERVPDVPSHLVLDNSTGFLYIADTGNNAIKVLDTTSGVRGSDISSMEWRVDHYQVDDADMWTLIDGSAAGLEQPSGLALVEDTLLVTDHATGFIYAFDLDGELIDWLDTERGSDALMGIEARSLEDVWFVDAAADKVFRLQPAE